MTAIDPKSPAGQETDPSITPAPSVPPPPPDLHWSDPEAARAWLSGLREAIADVKAVTEDQQRPRRKRRLGPAEAERITREAFVSIEKALALAEGGLHSVEGQREA